MSLESKRVLAERIESKNKELTAWYAEHARKAPPPFYCSVDLRDSGDKVAPVDSNLYPAGFNNICGDDLATASPVVRKEAEILFGGKEKLPRKVLLIPESHTHNLYYIENLYFLTEIMRKAGFEVELGWCGPTEDHDHPVQLVSASGQKLVAHPVETKDGTLSVPGFVPDAILLNNDFSGGYPEFFDRIRQPIFPSHRLGWHSRKKSEHFECYNALAKEFATIIDIDPWLIQIETHAVGPVNFNENQGVEEVAAITEGILQRTAKAYADYKIDRKPFVFVKNNSGTYGMGIMVVHGADELRRMNRRTKNKMSMGKNHRPIDSVVIQEGIPTETRVDQATAEPVIYLFGSELIGGFLRTNPEKSAEDNLNSPGMVFKKLCMSDLRNRGDSETPFLELVYGSIARISALAAGQELARKKL